MITVDTKAERAGKTSQVVTDEMIEEIPAKRFALPAEIAGLAVFLASSEASYINGVSIPVDGGRTSSI